MTPTLPLRMDTLPEVDRQSLATRALIIAISATAFIALTGIFINVTRDGEELRLAINGVALLMCALVARALWRHKTQQGVYLFLGLICLLFSVSTLVVGGVRTPNYVGFLALVVLTSACASRRTTLITYGAFVTLGALSLIFPRPHSVETFPSDLRYWIIYALVGLVITATTLITRQTFNEALQKLSAREALLSSLLEASSEPLIALNERGEVTHLNSSAARLDEQLRAEGAGGVFEVLFRDARADVRATLGGILEEMRAGDLSAQRHLHLVTPHRQRWLCLSASPQRVEGRDVGTVLFLRDITDQHALAQAQKMGAVSALAGGLTHDFNNMLSAISSATELLTLDPDAPSDERAELLGVIQGATERAALLTGQLRGLARSASAHMSPLDLFDLLRAVTLLLRRAASARHSLTLELDDQAAFVVGDEGHLHAAFMNLGLNALQATPRGGRVTIRAHLCAPQGGEGRGRVRVEVEDDGVGMSPEARERCFEPFFSEKGVGHSGLGLSVTHATVERHGGVIEAESALGRGSLFRVSLPLTSPPSVEGELTPALTPPHDPARPLAIAAPVAARALVIDDEPLVRRALLGLLAALGVPADAAASGDEGVRLAHEHPGRYQVVLLDMLMPAKTGVEVFYELQERHPALPVILCTAFSPEGTIEELRGRGLAGVLRKPYDLRALRAALARVGVGGVAADGGSSQEKQEQ